MTDAALIARIDDRLDQLVNLDIGERGIEPLFWATKEIQKGSLVGQAADACLSIPEGGTVLMTTGSVSRAWITTQLGENDGPSGAAALARALVMAKNVTVIMVVEDTLKSAIGNVMAASGLFPLSWEEAQIAKADRSLASCVMMTYPCSDEEGKAQAAPFLDQFKPDLLISTERVGRNVEGIYHSMKGLDYGMGRARVDYVFDEALKRSIPVVAIGDGGNEIGMGKVADEVRQHIPFGDVSRNGEGKGIGAITSCDYLVTAACSNWGCTAIVAAMAARMGNAKLLHTPEREGLLLDTMVANHLINSTHGVIDDNVDGFPRQSHLAITQICANIVARAF